MLIKIAGVFCNARSPSWWQYKEYKGCLSKGLLWSIAKKSCWSQNPSTSQKTIQTAEQPKDDLNALLLILPLGCEFNSSSKNAV